MVSLTRVTYVLTMKKLLHAILPVMLLAAPPAGAGDNVVLVELFTSQGCSSCPPADANLGALAQRDDVLPLSLHVDYWDYLGWRDTFGKTEHTERQHAYRITMGARVVYTPQMIVHGTHDVPGYHSELIHNAIAEAAATTAPASIQILANEGMLGANVTTDSSQAKRTIWVATYDQEATVRIERGENAGETITYSNIVEKLMRVGPWPGGTSQTIDLPQPGAGEGVAIWLQDDRTGRVLAASFVEG